MSSPLLCLFETTWLKWFLMFFLRRCVSCVCKHLFVCFQLFSEMVSEDHNGQGLAEIRDLAKRLAMSFGVDLNRVRQPLMALHM